MPYVRKNLCVFKRDGGKLIKVGCSKTVPMAKKYLKKLYLESSKSEK